MYYSANFKNCNRSATRQILGLSNFEADTFDKKRYGDKNYFTFKVLVLKYSQKKYRGLTRAEICIL